MASKPSLVAAPELEQPDAPVVLHQTQPSFYPLKASLYHLISVPHSARLDE
jgi:hypothetical protein